MAYCTGKSKATIEYSFGDGKVKLFETGLIPIEVEKVEPENTAVCWRFAGQGVGNDSYYEHFACGTSPSFVSNGAGLNLFMDGAMIQVSGYYYRFGTNSVNRVSKLTPTNNFLTSGNCDCSEECEIKVSKNGQIIFSDKGVCPVKFDVTCDEDCPEGSHKCTHNKYPGYCCLPCEETGQRINNIANKIR